VVERKSGQVLSKAGNVVQLMDMKEYTMFELVVPEDRLATIEAGQELVYIESMGKRKLD
jgi:translation initiation factor 5A